MFGFAKSRLSAAELARSYAGDLRNWVSGIARRYQIAAIVLIGSILALLIAVGFGIAAGFHFVAIRYGENVAFASFGGCFFCIAVIGCICGMVMLKRKNPPIPRPQIQALARSIAIPVTVKALGRENGLGAIARDPVAQIMLAASAALALGWIVSTNRGVKTKR